VHTVVDLITLANEYLGTDLEPADAERDLAELACWDSVYLLRLVTLLEQKLGRPVPVAEMLEARSLGDIWTAAVAT
jgi:acyl carrier protein